MMSATESNITANTMVKDGWADVTAQIGCYDDKGVPSFQVNATHPVTGARVYIANLNVYRAHYAAQVA